MVTKTKYTKEEEKILYDSYAATDSYEEGREVVEQLVTKLGKTKGSIVAKLCKMQIYKSKLRVSSLTNLAPESKSSMVKRIQTMYGLPELIDLDKAPKLTLLKLLKEKV